MNEKCNIKIFVSSHKPTAVVKDSIFYPIQVGAGIKGRTKIQGFRYDNEGENISELNPKFCELTALYWAWKNCDAEYYGFFHYRRYFSFSNNHFPTDVWGNVIADSIDENFAEKYQLNHETIIREVEKYDIILPEKKDITSMPNMGKNMRDQYSGSGYLHQEDLDIMLSVLSEKYPDYLGCAKEYLKGKKTYLCNMFIMRKEIFNDYCNWLFDILFECEKRINYDNYSVEALRTPGHLAERLLNIYLARNNSDNHYKIKELQTVVILDTDETPIYKPAFKKNNIAIALSANDYYSPYMATVLTSIRENSKGQNNYDIFIMHKDISPTNQTRLLNIFNNRSNFMLRFIDISKYQGRFEKLFLRGHFTIETWFRLLMPEIMPLYDKVLYIDSDLVVCDDLATLYNTDIDGFLLAACRDADTAGLYNGVEPGKKEYMDNILKIKNPYEYFQAGVILFNLAEFRKQFTTDEMLKYASSYEWELLDQDVLNNLAQGRVKYVDMSWNVMFDWNNYRIKEIISRAPKALSDEYNKAHENPRIIHYAGPDKPWHQPLSDYAEVFWKYARMTVFYEEIILRMTEARAFGLCQNMKLRNRVKKKTASILLPRGTKRREFAKKVYIKVQNNRKAA